jgi:uroporphyrinogen-III synthase
VAGPIIAIRPEPGLSQTISCAAEIGVEIAGQALFEVRPVDWTVPDDVAFDGLLIGSANAIRHGGLQLALLLDLPVYAVGKTTAAIAEEAGFKVAKIGQGGLQVMLDELASKAIRFLRLAGQDHIKLLAPRSHAIVDRVVYQSHALTAPPALGETLGKDAVVMLHSAVAAEHFANECNRMEVDRANIRIAALGQRIAAAAGSGWKEIAVASEPTDAALLALIKNMCK